MSTPKVTVSLQYDDVTPGTAGTDPGYLLKHLVKRECGRHLLLFSYFFFATCLIFYKHPKKAKGDIEDADL
jgi:hypothetical protein